MFINLSLTSALRGGGWSTPRPGWFTPGKETQGAGWAPGSVWVGAENLAPSGTQSRGELLYRLRYPGQQSKPIR
jgi:hypothetical protein